MIFFILNFALAGDGTIFSRKTNPSFTDAKKCTCSSREGWKKLFGFCTLQKKVDYRISPLIQKFIFPWNKSYFSSITVFDNSRKSLILIIKNVCVSSVRYQFLRNHWTHHDETLHALITLYNDVKNAKKKFRFCEKKIFTK